MAAPDPHTEPEQFYRYAARRQKRGLAILPRPLDGRVPEARHVKMLRLRLVERLTLREVGERTGLTGTRVQQVLNHYFGIQRERSAPVAASEVKVPAGFIEVLREMVLHERKEGSEVVVAALREYEALEWERLRDSEGAERRAVWWNLKRIGSFLASVGADRDV